jgi:hypothetical protein
MRLPSRQESFLNENASHYQFDQAVKDCMPAE